MSCLQQSPAWHSSSLPTCSAQQSLPKIRSCCLWAALNCSFTERLLLCAGWVLLSHQRGAGSANLSLLPGETTGHFYPQPFFTALFPCFFSGEQLPKALLFIPAFANPRELQALILAGMGAGGRWCLLFAGCIKACLGVVVLRSVVKGCMQGRSSAGLFEAKPGA